MTPTATPVPDPDFWDSVWQRAAAAPAPGPDAGTLENDIDRGKLRFLRRRLPAAGVAVEVGCGSARLLARVGRAVPALRLVAVDPSPAALAVVPHTAAAFGVVVEARYGRAEALPFADGSVELVLSGGLLEHFPDPTPVLAEMVRVLKPGGVFYADVVPRKVSWYRRREAARMRRSEWMADGVYESAYGPNFYADALARLGCATLAARWCGVYPPFTGLLPGRFRSILIRAAGVLDGTAIAARGGWYFMLVGRKTGGSPERTTHGDTGR